LFAKLTKQFPLIPSPGLFGSILEAFVGVYDWRKATKEDKIRAAHYNAILGAEITDDEDRIESLFIRTANEQWRIYDHFTGHLEKMSSAVNMGISGKLSQIWQPKQTQPMTANILATSSQQITELLKKLGELRDAGVITKEEFELKKRELLARL
jgi:hypothetical protein